MVQHLINHATYMSNTSFQYGFNVFLMTEVVFVCSPPIVATAKGSGNPTLQLDACLHLLISSSLALTENISLVEPVSRNNWNHGQSAETLLEF
jgi:hypothetical protein